MSEKEAGQVLTSDNAAEFYANRLGLAESPSTEAEQSEPAEVVDQRSEPEEAEAEAKQEGERKQNPKLERRFSEITKQREEARKEAQSEREARQALEQRLAALESQGRPKANPTDEKPQPSQFSDAFEYAEALAEYTADKRIGEMKQQEAQAKEAEQRQKVITQWTSKVEAAKQALPDFDEIVASSDVVVNDDIRDAILESDVGPQILYHLAENDEIAKRIAGLSPKQALREIGKLEARFEAKESETEKPAPIVRSKAPAPIQPIRGGKNTPDVPMGSDGVFFGTAAQWKELRKSGKIR
jgi:hypothetical protein